MPRRGSFIGTGRRKSGSKCESGAKCVKTRTTNHGVWPTLADTTNQRRHSPSVGPYSGGPQSAASLPTNPTPLTLILSTAAPSLDVLKFSRNQLTTVDFHHPSLCTPSSRFPRRIQTVEVSRFAEKNITPATIGVHGPGSDTVIADVRPVAVPRCHQTSPAARQLTSTATSRIGGAEPTGEALSHGRCPL